MSRYADSDNTQPWDRDDEDDGPRFATVPRTCRRCGQSFDMAKAGDYILHVLCDRCWREVQAVQERKTDEAMATVTRS